MHTEKHSRNLEIAKPYLQILDAKLVSIHVDGRKENGFHLVVTQFIRGQMRSDEDLGAAKRSEQKVETLPGRRASPRASVKVQGSVPRSSS